MIETNKEMVSHPNHYNKGDKTYEPYRVISKWGCNFNIGNAIKYLARYKAKWNPIEDLEKAKQYIDFEIEALTGKGEVAQSNGQTKEPVVDCAKPILNGDRLQEEHEKKPEITEEQRKRLEQICRGTPAGNEDEEFDDEEFDDEEGNETTILEGLKDYIEKVKKDPAFKKKVQDEILDAFDKAANEVQEMMNRNKRHENGTHNHIDDIFYGVKAFGPSQCKCKRFTKSKF